MKNALLVLAILTSSVALAQKHDEKEAKEDVKRHRALAQVHEAAAKCMESGKPVKECHAQLLKECKGVGIGKYCGMKHQH